MHPGTGHLVSVETPDSQSRAERRQMEQELAKKGYEPVPKELERAAQKKLAGKSEAMVSLTSGGKLSRWAADRRKVRNRMAKDSRRKNRGR